MTRKQHYEAIARIIGNEMALGVNLIREEDTAYGSNGFSVIIACQARATRAVGNHAVE